MTALLRTRLLDAPEDNLDRLARLASRLLDVPVGLVSLVDVDRQFFAGQSGLPEAVATARQTPLSHSFCQSVVVDRDSIRVVDARESERFRDNLAVRDMDVIGYLGVPLRSLGGEVLGSLCAIDTKPKEWTDEDLTTLQDIALAVEAEIEMRALLAERDTALEYQTHARARVELERSRYMLLTRVGDITSSIDDRQDLARLIAEAVVPVAGDWCVVELTPAGGSRERAVGFGAATVELRAQVEEIRDIARGWPGWRSPTLLALEEQAPSYLPFASLDDMVEPDYRDAVPPRLAELVQLTGLNVVSAVPLAARGRIVGAMSFIRRDRARGFDTAELALHHEIARRAALAIDGAAMRVDLEQRAQAAVAIETIADGVILLDAERRVRLWNPAIANWTAVCADSAIGHTIDELLPDVAKALDHHLRGDRAERLLEIEHTGDGARHWAALSVESNADGAVLALRDLTEEHALEQTRHELIATVSHQLRTPVASVLAAAITLQRTDIELDDATRGVILDTIVEQGQRLSDLSADVLLAYRLGSGAHHVVEVPVELAPLLTQVVGGARVSTGAAHPISLELPDDLPPVVGDEHALVQVFGNLVDNAHKYSPDGGRISVRARVTGADVVVEVDDEGIGIPESEHERVFERFHRLDPDMARVAGGSGLGLFVARELLRLMGGRITIESRAPGTRFRVTLHQS